MTATNFERVLESLHKRTPFHPFTVEFVSGAQIVVDHPEALVMRGGVAVYLSKAGVPTLFDHEGVCRVDGDNTVASA
jgi:hypothetical protein